MSIANTINSVPVDIASKKDPLQNKTRQRYGFVLPDASLNSLHTTNSVDSINCAFTMQ